MDRKLARRNLRTAFFASIVGVLMFALTFVAAWSTSNERHELDDNGSLLPSGRRSTCRPRASCRWSTRPALALAIVCITLSWVLVVVFGIIFLWTTIRWVADTRRDIAELPLDHRTTSGIRFPRRGDRGRHQRPALRAYSAAFAAYLADRAEEALGAAYDLGREAVAAQLSVLDLADAHHSALRDARGSPSDDAGRRGRLPAREPVDVRDRPPRLPRGPGGRAARARVRRAAARAGRRVGGDQLRADRRGDPAADRRHRPLDHPRRPRDGRHPRPGPAAAAADRHLSPAPERRRRRSPRGCRREPDRPRQGARGARGRRRARPRRSRRATRRSSPSSRSSPASRSPTPSSTSASARSPARCSARCARARSRRCPGSAPPCASAPRARGSSSAATSTTSSPPATAPGRR